MLYAGLFLIGNDYSNDTTTLPLLQAKRASFPLFPEPFGKTSFDFVISGFNSVILIALLRWTCYNIFGLLWSCDNNWWQLTD